MTRLIAISDTHGRHRSMVHPVPDGDILIHVGDCTHDKGRASLRDFLVWFNAFPHPYKLFIAGNHDWAFEQWPDLARAMVKEIAPSVTYLQDSGTEVCGLKVWGSPISCRFFDWAFNRDRGAAIKRHWDMIPNDTDLLITHGPPRGYGDWVPWDRVNAGDDDLLDAIRRGKPRYHFAGHFHSGHGMRELVHDDGSKTVLVNATICDEQYSPINAPWVIDL